MRKRMLKFTAVLAAFSLLVSGGPFFNANGSLAYADEITAEFEIDSQLLRALTENNTFALDKNKDNIITLEEMSDNYGIQIDCEGYDIKDWSALKYGSGWKFVAINNVSEANLSSLGELNSLNSLIINCDDFSKITGLEKIKNLKEIKVESKADVDLSSFCAYPSISDISVTAPKATNHAALEGMDIYALSLAGDSKDGLEDFPKLNSFNKLSLAYSDVTDADMKNIVLTNPGLRNVSVTGAQLSGLSWIHDLKYLYTLDVRNNLIRDIRPVLNHKNIKHMDLSISGNPLAPDSEEIFVKQLLEIEDNIVGKVGESKFYNYLINTDWKCDLIGNLTLYCGDVNIAEVDGYNIRLKSEGETTLYVTDGKDVNLQYKISVKGGLSYPPTPTPVPTNRPIGDTLGDVDFNGKVNAVDALLVLKHSAKILTLKNDEFKNADVNVDYKVTAIDARHILEYVAGLITSFDSVKSNATPPPVPTEPMPTIEPTPKPTTGYEFFDSINVEFDYSNSFIAEILSEDNKTYTVEDFPSTNLTDVWTRGKVKTEEGYLYQLVMVLDKTTCTDEILKDTMENFRAISGVNKVYYNEYFKHETILNLNYQEYELEVGEKISLYIDDYRPCDVSSHNIGLVVKYNDNAISNDVLEKYGIEHADNHVKGHPTSLWYENTEADSFLLVYSGVDNEINCLTAAHLLSQRPEVDMIQIVEEIYPTGARYYENWECSDTSIASMDLSGGVEDIDHSTSITKLDQTATITGLVPGEVTISVTKGGWGNLEGTGTCVIKVVEHNDAVYEAEYPKMAQYADYYTDDAKYRDWKSSRNAQKSAYYQYENALSDFYDKTITKALSDSNGKNIVYSPLNVYMALALVAETSD